MVYFNHSLFQNNIWKLLILYNTALIWASQNGHAEIVKLLVEQEGFDVNVKTAYLLSSIFILIIW